jgi:hypothetical protein
MKLRRALSAEASDVPAPLASLTRRSYWLSSPRRVGSVWAPSQRECRQHGDDDEEQGSRDCMPL